MAAIQPSSYAGLGESFVSEVSPAPLKKSHWVHINKVLLADLGLDDTSLDLGLFSGQPSDVILPTASVYAGHQFGNYAGRLGDGRAMLLGEVKDPQNKLWELQLKGAGQTPYSRGADGRAVLRSTIREYLCSEAMHGLGIPTSRALCITGSEEQVYRESIETGAIVARLAPSHIRFGNFEWFYYQQEFPQLKTLADFVIAEYYPEVQDAENPYLALLSKVIVKTANSISQWQLVGFCHGVMNTDNMSILGLTIDYGPFGFLDAYDPKYICNHSDHQGRYAYDQQPYIGLWNLRALAQTFLPLVNFDDPDLAVKQVQAALDTYQPQQEASYHSGMAAKLGLADNENTQQLSEDILALMAESEVDYTLFFRKLSSLKVMDKTQDVSLGMLFARPRDFFQWTGKYRNALQSEDSNDAERQQAMDAVNPAYVLRNHLAQTAIEKAEAGDFTEVDRLFRALENPFEEHEEFTDYSQPPAEDLARVVVSCSS